MCFLQFFLYLSGGIRLFGESTAEIQREGVLLQGGALQSVRGRAKRPARDRTLSGAVSGIPRLQGVQTRQGNRFRRKENKKIRKFPDRQNAIMVHRVSVSDRISGGARSRGFHRHREGVRLDLPVRSVVHDDAVAHKETGQRQPGSALIGSATAATMRPIVGTLPPIPCVFFLFSNYPVHKVYQVVHYCILRFPHRHPSRPDSMHLTDTRHGRPAQRRTHSPRLRAALLVRIATKILNRLQRDYRRLRATKNCSNGSSFIVTRNFEYQRVVEDYLCRDSSR